MGIALSLHSLLIALRVMLGVNLSMMKMYSNTDPEIVQDGMRGRIESFSKNTAQKASKKVLDKSVSALKTAGTAEMKVAAIGLQYSMRHADGSIKQLKRLIRFVDFLIVLLILLDLLVIVFIIVLILLLIGVVSFVISGGVTSGASDAGGDTSSNQAASGGNDSPVSTVTGDLIGTEAVPANMDAKKWNEASPNGKRIASTAIIVQNMKFPGDPKNDRNNGRLVYQQGVDLVGYYDCNVFASAVYESLGFTEAAGPRKGKPYDFKTMNRADLQGWKPTASAVPYLNGKVKPIGTAKKGMDTSNLHPGDLLIGGGHAMIYVGKNSKGQDLVVHALHSRSTIYSDVLLTHEAHDVGITTLDWILPSMTSKGTVYIFRSDDLINAK